MDKVRAYAGRELVYLALGVMEVMVFTPLIAALFSPIVTFRPLSLTLSLLGAVMVVHYLARFSLGVSLRPALRSGLLGLGVLVSGLVTVHQVLHAEIPFWNLTWLLDVLGQLQYELPVSDVLVFLLVLAVWWRGLVLAQRSLDSISVAYRFRLNLVLLTLTTVVSGSVFDWPYHHFVFAFFFASLMGIALARADEMGEQYGGSRSPFSLVWLTTLLAAGLTVLLLAGGLAALLTNENLGIILLPLLHLLRILLFGVVYVMARVAQFLLTPLMALFGRQGVGEAISEMVENMTPPEEIEREIESGAVTVAPEQMAVIRTVGIILGLLLLLLLVITSLRRLRERSDRQLYEVRESVWEGASLRQGLGDWLRRGRQRLGEAMSGLNHTLLNRFLTAMTIRRIYAHLSALAGDRGYPRADHETPYEYLPTLQRAFPSRRDDVVAITEAYVAVHYGEVPERAEALEAVQAAWKRVQETASEGPLPASSA